MQNAVRCASRRQVIMKRYILSISVLIIGLSSCQYETRRLNHFEVHGLDVSHYQASISWDTVAQQAVHFAFVKATEGESFVDSLFCHNWTEIQRVGIKRGAYHFFRPTLSAEAQFRNFVRTVDMQSGDLPPVLDVEVIDEASKVELITKVRTWLYLVEIRYRIKPILYSNQKFYNRYLAGHFDDYPVWIARYNTQQPSLAYDRAWHFWQYGNRGRIDGVEGYVDFNVFEGSLADLEQLCWNPATAALELEPEQYAMVRKYQEWRIW